MPLRAAYSKNTKCTKREADDELTGLFVTVARMLAGIDYGVTARTS